MSIEDIKNKLEQVAKGFEDFKKKNDERIAETEKKGSADPLVIEALDKINKSIEENKAAADETKKFLDKAATVKARGNLSYSEVEKQDLAVKGLAKYLTQGEKNLSPEEVKAFSIGNSGEGGYMLAPELRELIKARLFDTSPMRQYATVISTTADQVDFPIQTNRVNTGWVGEQTSRTETSTNAPVGIVKIPVKEIYSEPFVTQRFLDTVGGAETMVVDMISEAIMLDENTAFVSGDGNEKPAGFLNNVSELGTTYSSSAVQFVKSGSNGSFDFDDVINLRYQLKSGYTQGANWFANRDIFRVIRTFKDSYGQYLWQPSLVAGQPDTLLGYAAIEANDMPVAATNSLSLAFGNFKKGYTVVDGKNLTILRDPYSNKPYVVFYTLKDTGGAVTVAEAIKVLKLAA